MAAQALALAGEERLARIVRSVHGRFHQCARPQEHDQTANVMEQAGHEKSFDVGLAALCGDTPREHAARQAVLPERMHVDQFGRHVLEHPGDGCSEREVPDLARSNDCDCLAHRVDRLWEREHRGVDGAE